jgi:mRNA-degrading endonuclease RelE of RelBE toxin-antitoxin system
MQVIFDEDARKDLKNLSERILFHRHIKKLLEIGPRKHFSYKIDAYKENVGADGRIVFMRDEDEDTLRIMRCFTDHKDYEKWYKSYKK